MGQHESRQAGEFHPRHGKNIQLSENNTVAHRVRDFDQALVYSSKPISRGEVFQVRLLEKAETWSGSVKLGLTTESPDEAKIPSSALKIFESPDHWILTGTKVIHQGKEGRLKIDLESLRVGQTVGCSVSEEGNLHLIVDGTDLGVVGSRLPTKHQRTLWGFADVYGTCGKIRSAFYYAKEGPSQQQQQPAPARFNGSSSLPTPFGQAEDYDHTRVVSDDLGSLQVAELQQSLAMEHVQKVELEERNTSIQRVNTLLKKEKMAAADENWKLEEKVAALREQLSQQREEINRLNGENSHLRQQLEGALTEAQTLQQELDSKTVELQSQSLSAVQRQEPHPPVIHTPEIGFWNVSSKEIEVLENKILGRGAWGYVAEGRFRGKQVAVKRVYREILEPHTVDRIHREISTMAQVRHPNLVLFIAAVLDDRVDPMIITEILTIDLRSAYRQNKLETNAVKLQIFQDVAYALNYLHLHKEPIIHRDVSAPNVLLEEMSKDSWKAKLSDFGSANLVRLAATPGEGAIIYAAPETFPQLPNSPNPLPSQTPKIDVYSYGVLLCEVITCQFPDPSKFSDMLGMVHSQWPLMHSLITSSTEHDPVKRPTMENILEKLCN